MASPDFLTLVTGSVAHDLARGRPAAVDYDGQLRRSAGTVPLEQSRHRRRERVPGSRTSSDRRPTRLPLARRADLERESARGRGGHALVVAFERQRRRRRLSGRSRRRDLHDGDTFFRRRRPRSGHHVHVFRPGVRPARQPLAGGSVSVTTASSKTDYSAPDCTGRYGDASDHGLTVSWTASTDNVGVAYYRIYPCLVAHVLGRWERTLVHVVGLPIRTKYDLQVLAVDGDGNTSGLRPRHVHGLHRRRRDDRRRRSRSASIRRQAATATSSSPGHRAPTTEALRTTLVFRNNRQIATVTVDFVHGHARRLHRASTTCRRSTATAASPLHPAPAYPRLRRPRPLHDVNPPTA